MSLTAREYLRAWESEETGFPCLNSRLIPGSCVLEMLSIAIAPDLRYVFVDDFGYATAYCRRRLQEDLTPPDEREGTGRVERWRRQRAAFSRDDLAEAWTAADAAFALLLDSYTADGYSCALGDRLREIVFAYSLDLELGEIYVLPDDIEALLARAGDALACQDARAGRPTCERGAFDFADTKHRAALLRWLCKANTPA